MKQIAFLIDASWLQDEETMAAVRYSCLQILAAWPGDRVKFGYLVFDSEGSRAQKVTPVDFAAPLTSLVEEFEAQLRQTPATEAARSATHSSHPGSQLETIRWAVSRSVTDFGWHAVSVCSPVKASRKRRIVSTASAQASQPLSAGHRPGGDGDDRRNLLFIFAQTPAGTLTRLGDELVTPSLAKCLQERRIGLIWVHDAGAGVSVMSAANTSRCLFLRMRDLVQLCGFFVSDYVHQSTAVAPPSQIIARLLETAIGEALPVTVVPTHASSRVLFDATAPTLTVEAVVDEPTVTSVLHRTLAVFFVTSADTRFHRMLAELKAAKRVAMLSSGRQTFMLNAIVDSVGALASLTDKGVTRFESNEATPDAVFHGGMLERWLKVEHQLDHLARPRRFMLLSRLASAYESTTDAPLADSELRELEVEPLANATPVCHRDPTTCPASVSYSSESALLRDLKHMYEKSVEGKLNATTSAQSISSAIMRFFESDGETAAAFIEEHFKPPLDSALDKTQWANGCRMFILISFEAASLSSRKTDAIKSRVIATMRKLLFLTSPRDLFDFVRQTLANLYVDTVRPLLDDLAEEFDLPLFPYDSDTEEEMSPVGSFADPMSGISSLGGGSVSNSMGCSASVPSSGESHKASVLRRLSSANLSQQQAGQPRQIEVPRRRSVRMKEPESSTNPPGSARSPQKGRGSSRQMPTTPKGKRVLKTQVVPETPVAKQAPNRVQRNQERLRRRSSILNSSQGGSVLEEDDVDEIDESPVKRSPRTTNKSPLKKARTSLTPTKENVAVGLRRAGTALTLATGPSPTRQSPRTTPRKHLTRQLKFSPQKKEAFTSPTATSLLHLTTSPVLYRPGKRRLAPSE
ncbi:hypothetical protein BIW11_12585 [Tropilaelaps mercedesae]|uniref:Treslin N-terminal domain-containing protein n=1 Tax=Tropilaelaps mercedesae TaxID=418985 RepID=A0A1V9X610_9ACAR|nr:hypothetical protein BIW11_12585 [Tropilaelaps mercedesae]